MTHNQLEVGVYLVLIVVILGLIYSHDVKADTVNTYSNTYGNVSTTETYNNQGYVGRTDTTYNSPPAQGNTGTSGTTVQISGYTQPMANETY